MTARRASVPPRSVGGGVSAARRGRVPVVVLVALLAALLSGCSPQTLGAPRDGYEVQARFETVENLVVGHAVRLADVPVGTVVGVELDGYEALVTMAVEPHVALPRGTVASIRRTSLLGEDFVSLERPDDDPPDDPVGDGEELPTGPPRAGLEEVAHQGLRLMSAVAADDAVELVDALHHVVDGRERQLADLIVEVGEVSGHYAARTTDIGRAIDGVADLGDELATATPDVDGLVGDLDDAVTVIAAQRERMVSSLQGLVRLSAAAEGSVLGETREDLERVLAELGPVVGDLADDEERLDELVAAVVVFAERLQETITDEELDLYGLLMFGSGEPAYAGSGAAAGWAAFLEVPG
jgi:phospholipid/cholesterol/gamma-HCH transport system substrate-binding protein